MASNNTEETEIQQKALIQTVTAIPKPKYGCKLNATHLTTSSPHQRFTLRKAEDITVTNFSVFDIELKGKAYTSFNNYTVIPPIKTKSSKSQQNSSADNNKSEDYQVLLKQEIEELRQNYKVLPVHKKSKL